MDVKAIAKEVRISPIKLRLMADLVRGKSTTEAQNILRNYNSKSARVILKVVNSAVANAVNNNKLDESKLFVKEIRVDMGQTLKRRVPGSRGSIDKNFHRASHVTVIVAEKENIEKKALVEEGKKSTKKTKQAKES